MVCRHCLFYLIICLIDGHQSHPIIQWFTPRLFPHFDVNQSVIVCGSDHLSCISTVDENIGSADALIFYGSDLDWELKSLPFSKSSAKWALLHEESPLNNYRLSSKQVLNSLFDISATFERNSSFPLTTQFLKSLEYLRDTQLMIGVEEKNKLKESQRLAPVVYVQSNCNVPSDRDRYVHKLMQFLDIDSYGKCLNNKLFESQNSLNSSLNFDSQEFYKFLSKYKFMISFENAICDDYISEKLWRSLHLAVIPIYRGSQTIADWLPNNISAIIVDKELETNPSKLAQIITYLDRNDDKYNEYLKWKTESTEELNANLLQTLSERKWTLSDDNHYIRGFECYVCEVLHRKDNQIKSYLNGCPEPMPALGLSASQLNETDEWLYWFFQWNDAKDFSNQLKTTKIYTKQEL